MQINRELVELLNKDVILILVGLFSLLTPIIQPENAKLVIVNVSNVMVKINFLIIKDLLIYNALSAIVL
jgi:hypothetical protein